MTADSTVMCLAGMGSRDALAPVSLDGSRGRRSGSPARAGTRLADQRFRSVRSPLPEVARLAVVPPLTFARPARPGDGTIRVWHTPTLSLVYLIHPPHDNIGDILSLAWIPYDTLAQGAPAQNAAHSSPNGPHLRDRKPAGRLFAGCQDTSIQVRVSLAVRVCNCGC